VRCWNHLASAEGHGGVSHKNWWFQKGFGLPVSSQKPGPNAKTEQRNGDHCERKRRQPDWHAAHIEGPDDRCNHRCDCHTKKDSKGQIWLPAPGYAPQNQEQEKTGYLQQCCHDRKNPAEGRSTVATDRLRLTFATPRMRPRGAAQVGVSASCPGTDGSRCNPCRASARARRAESSSPHAWQPRAPIRGSRDRVPPRLPAELAEESRSHVPSRSHH